MDQRIIDTYGINFTIKEIDFEVRGREIVKNFNSNEESLNELLNSLDNPQNLLDYLMPDIDQAQASPGSEFENGSATINIIIDHIKVDFFNDDFDLLFTMPTSDFKEIVEGWIEFLFEFPVNGSKSTFITRLKMKLKKRS